MGERPFSAAEARQDVVPEASGGGSGHLEHPAAQPDRQSAHGLVPHAQRQAVQGLRHNFP